MVNVGIIGATGYAGEELIEILLRHPGARITNVSAKIDRPQRISQIFPKFKDRINIICEEPDVKKIIAASDLVFLALPHTVSMEFVPKLLKAGKKVIDLSADYRLKDTRVYEKFYNTKHRDKLRLSEAIYGLPELYRAKIKTARLIANPGCYPTVCILALAPLVACNLVSLDSIIIDAKSGVTGAGRKVAEGFLFSEINEDFKAYKVGVHQHSPEINQELSKLSGKEINVTFVPHLLPLNRGILATIYVRKAQSAKRKAPALPAGRQNLVNLYKKFYKKEPFVRIRDEGDFPRIKDVLRTNFCDIAIQDSSDKIIIVAAIDNLLKGAAGQAV
ncbi:MAG: N-acetyl-gamma-glutamyl-phosphate reductase, partial [Candidatus Omnitrophica bacterium]|nr:N-acetyl-gamma-glutamyl-phosphate reductase [Candidatus Omnitrophota bacterium]